MARSSLRLKTAGPPLTAALFNKQKLIS